MRGKKVPIIVIVIPSPRFVSQRARIFRSSRDFLAQREGIYFSGLGKKVWKILDWIEKYAYILCRKTRKVIVGIISRKDFNNHVRIEDLLSGNLCELA